MKTIRWLVFSLAALAGFVSYAGCGSGGGSPKGDGGMADGSGGMGGGDGMDGGGGGAPLEFSAFVLDLVNNQTKDDTLPVTIDDKTFVDSMSPTAFDSLFP